MSSFVEVKNAIHLVRDTILSDMVYEGYDNEELKEFTQHLVCTKSWFARLSYVNKRRFVSALIEDTKSLWALSLMLKSIWISRTKDALMSAYRTIPWSTYDHAPLDHNRTARPVATLCQVMNSERRWYNHLEPEHQALVLTELLSLGGGPLVWDTLRRAENVYDHCRELCIDSIVDSHVVAEVGDKNVAAGDQHLVNWNATIKAMRNNLKLEEFEVTLKDDTTKRMWKVNRLKPEAVETVDYLQLIPSSVAKQILSFLPRAQLGDYARVNKYWAFLVDELKAELAARVKIQAELDRLQEIIYRHDQSLEMMPAADLTSTGHDQSVTTSRDVSTKKYTPSTKPSEKSNKFAPDKVKRPYAPSKPIRNLSEMTSRLERRGAADENVFRWCRRVLRDSRLKGTVKNESEGLLNMSNDKFPCPLLKYHIDIPLKIPLEVDPALAEVKEPRRRLDRNMFTSSINDDNEGPVTKRYSLWSKDFSSLYPVLKVPSHQYPQ